MQQATHAEYNAAQAEIARHREALALLDQFGKVTENKHGWEATRLRQMVGADIQGCRRKVADKEPVTWQPFPVRLVHNLPGYDARLRVGPYNISVDAAQLSTVGHGPTCENKTLGEPASIRSGYSSCHPIATTTDSIGKAKIRVEFHSYSMQNSADVSAWLPVGFVAHLKHNRVVFVDDKGWGFAMTHERYTTRNIGQPVWVIAGRGGNNRFFKRRFMTSLPDGSALVRKTLKELTEVYTEQLLASMSAEFSVNLGGATHYTEYQETGA